MYIVILMCLIWTFAVADEDKQLQGKVAIITGGAKGIGYAITNNFLKNGIKTAIIVDKNLERGLKAEKIFTCKYGAKRILFIHGDITKDLDEVYHTIFKTYGRVDILVNNAGILNEEDPKLTIETNALATVLWTDRYFQYMRKDKGGKGGTIINIASVSSYMSDPFFYYYKASKFAVLGLSLGMGHEYNFLYSGVRIFAICPGYTRTDMTMSQQITLDEHVEVYNRFSNVSLQQGADDVGKATVVLFETATTGTAYTVEGGRPPRVSPDRINISADYLLSLLSN